MRTSNLPKNFFVLFFVFLFGSALISGCTMRTSTPAFQRATNISSASAAININTATAADLEKLPHVGPALAAKIVEHRRRYGPFRRIEQILLVDGMSEARFRELRKFINTE
jgi:competence ComEA-like helix-hairpin-helix protein